MPAILSILRGVSSAQRGCPGNQRVRENGGMTKATKATDGTNGTVGGPGSGFFDSAFVLANSPPRRENVTSMYRT